MNESVFVTKLQIERRIVIPRPITEALDIKRGDKVMVKIWKAKQ